MSGQERIPFPVGMDAFDQDDRISFSKVDGKWILEDHDGSEWEYLDQLSKWVPSLDESLLEQQRQAYAVPGVTEDDDGAAERKKRKKQIQEDNASKRRKALQEPSKSAAKNSAIYITNLPHDTTVNELASVFSKWGIIAEEIDTNRQRIKLYTDEAGHIKGDALIVYHRTESVQLAIDMMDDTDLRLGQPHPMGKMRVKEADFSYKKSKEGPAVRNTKDKNKIIKKTQKMNNKLTDWDDDDPQKIHSASKWAKVVILKHMFTLEELDEDAAAMLDIKEDIREECSKLGQVTNVVLYDKEKDGIVSVKFADEQSAESCVKLMHGRHFAGNQVIAYIPDGDEGYKKSNERAHAFDDENESEQRRLDQFGKWLEKDKST